MAITFKKPSGQAVTSKELKNKGESVLEETITEPIEVAPSNPEPDTLCEVGFETSFTKNLGNYQSLKVGVQIKIPCIHGEINQVFDYATNWADAKMQKLLEETNE